TFLGGACACAGNIASIAADNATATLDLTPGARCRMGGTRMDGASRCDDARPAHLVTIVAPLFVAGNGLGSSDRSLQGAAILCQSWLSPRLPSFTDERDKRHSAVQVRGHVGVR